MKKYLLFLILILCVTTAFVGCGKGDESSLIVISSGGKEIYPLERDYIITGNSWLDVTGDVIQDEVYENVPEVTFGRDFSVKFSKKVSLHTVHFRNEGSEDILHSSDVNFSVLDEGSYYVDIIVEKDGKQYSCALKLLIPERESAPVVNSRKDPVVSIEVKGKKIPVYTEVGRDETKYNYVDFNERLDEVKDQIPVIPWSEGMDMKLSKGCESWGISVYDLSGNGLEESISDFSALSTLNGGDYYFRVYVVENYEDGKQDYTGYNCVFRMSIPDLDPFVIVTSNGVETVAQKYWYCSMSWHESENGSGWVFSDGPGIYADMEGIFSRLPEVVMDDDFSIRYGENINADNSFHVYDENYQEIDWFDLERLKRLENGTYYVVTTVFRNGTEIHEGETGYDGYACVFKLVIPETVKR